MQSKKFTTKHTVRLTRPLKFAIKYDAAKRDITMSHWIRQACIEKMRSQKKGIIYKDRNIKIKISKIR